MINVLVNQFIHQFEYTQVTAYTNIHMPLEIYQGTLCKIIKY